MRTFSIAIMFMFLSVNSIYAEVITGSSITGTAVTICEPQTDDRVNPELLNTLPAVNILNLSGVDCEGNEIEQFMIQTIPDEVAGRLYMADGVTEICPNQILTRQEAESLLFDPNENFEGNVTFTYSSIDCNDVEDSTPAVVTIPIVRAVVAPATTDINTTTVTDTNETTVSTVTTDNSDTNNTIDNTNCDVNSDTYDANCGCTAYEESVSLFSSIGLFLMLLLTSLQGYRFLRKDALV